ncbi:MAG: hypothetical protein ABEJ82_00260 [Haloplanus sp.]
MSSATDTPTYRERRRAALDAIPPIARTVVGDEIRITRGFRGTSLDAAVGYLENLGGERVADSEVAGEGWRATLSTRTVPIGAYRLTELLVTWTGDPAALEPVVTGFRLKAFRAPG